MITTPKTDRGCSAVHTTAQKRTLELPANAVTLEVLKLFEGKLHERRLLAPPPPLSFNPLWFFAELERDNYLWRSHLSLSDSPRFIFWINVPQLIAKRLTQLQRNDRDNPLINPLWSISSVAEESTDEERRYLVAFERVFNKVALEAHAIARVGQLVAEELEPSRIRTTVLLPLPGRRRQLKIP